MANQFTIEPYPFTEEQLYEDYVNNLMTQVEIAEKYGIGRKRVYTALHKMGIPTRKAYKRYQTGETNHAWKGGRVLSRHLKRKTKYKSSGYYLVKCPEHPHANKDGYVAEHILVALKTAGIEKLPEGCCVHHINEDKSDNRPENLIICTQKQHGYYHATIIPLIKQLLEHGVIVFDKENGYTLKGVDCQ